MWFDNESILQRVQINLVNRKRTRSFQSCTRGEMYVWYYGLMANLGNNLIYNVYYSKKMYLCSKIKYLCTYIIYIPLKLNIIIVNIFVLRSYIVFCLQNLTGGIDGGVHITDVTNASRTMLMNIHSLRWDTTLMEYVQNFITYILMHLYFIYGISFSILTIYYYLFNFYSIADFLKYPVESYFQIYGVVQKCLVISLMDHLQKL